MPSTYSNLKIELVATGEQSGTWGTTTNTNLGTAVEEAITGSANVAFSSGDVTISLSNTNASQTARNLRLNLTGTSGGARVLTVPAIEKQYIVNNGLADACTVKNSTGTGIAVPAGKTMVLFNDGTNVVDATTHLSSLTLSTDLAVADGGTGASDAATARTNLGLGTMATQNGTSVSISGGSATGLSNLTTTNFTASGTATSSGTLAVTGGLTLDGAAGTAGQFLTSAGAGNTPTWTTLTAFVSGMIMLWSGSTGTIPSGWALCDGTSGTPDLRDRFVVGAGSTYAVDATGGSADAITVSHTHTLTDSGHTHGAGSYQINTGGDAAQNSTNGAVFRSTIQTATSVTGTSASATTGISIASAGSSGTNANLPPYYALAYIMKT
jgi:two-component sensor histidine kinase